MNFDDVLNATNGGPAIISQQDDTSKIGQGAGGMLAGTRVGVGSGWDANEMQRITESEARRIMADGTEEERNALIMAAVNRAKLATTASGEIMLAVAGEPAWHTLGKLVSRPMNGTEALELSGTDYTVSKQPTFIVDCNGEKIETGAFSMIRDDTGEILNYGSSVGQNYREFQNAEMVEFLDELISSGLEIVTAGATCGGAKVWYLAKNPLAIEVADGDTVDPYVLITAAHDGSGQVRIFATSDRVVCHNTRTQALRNGRGKGFAMRHTSGMKSKLPEARRALGYVKQSHEQYREQAQTLAKTQLSVSETDDYFAGCLDSILDVTIADQQLTGAGIKDNSVLDSILEISSADERIKAEKSYRKQVKRRESALDSILERHESERCNGIKSIEGSAWSAYNAVNEWTQHGDAAKQNGDMQTRAERKLESRLIGRAAEYDQLAFEQALSLTM